MNCFVLAFSHWADRKKSRCYRNEILLNHLLSLRGSKQSFKYLINYAIIHRILYHLLPEKPGVYQFLDSFGNIIYVGKAKNLKKRVASYFSKNQSGKTTVMLKRAADMKHIVVDNESDALLLENNLIKKHQPRYNILLKG